MNRPSAQTKSNAQPPAGTMSKGVKKRQKKRATGGGISHAIADLAAHVLRNGPQTPIPGAPPKPKHQPNKPNPFTFHHPVRRSLPPHPFNH